MPVSIRMMPSPAASAQALQCGTPGNGSGRRRRHTPGRTRSPRPKPPARGGLRTPRGGTRPRVGLRTPRDGTVPGMEEPERVARDYFAALTERDLAAARAHLAPDVRG